MASTRTWTLASAIVLAALGNPGASSAAETVKVATSFLGLWDTSQPTFCMQRGAFEDAGLEVEVTNTRGGSENLQAVIAGGMDIGYSPGTNAVLSAFTKGADIKVISAEFTGQAGAFFYVPADSEIKGIGDLNGKTMAFPRPGGAMESLLLAFKNDNNLDVELVATGGMDATHTMVMTGQVDVGYSVVPVHLDALARDEIRMLLSSDQIESQQGITGRVIIASNDFLNNRHDVAVKFMKVLDECIDWAYENMDEAAAQYAEINKIDLETANQALGFYKREQLTFGELMGLDKTIDQAVRDGFIDGPLSDEQLDDLFDIIYTTPN